MATAAAAVAAARRRVISHFMQRNSVAPASAVQWVPERRLQRRQLDRLVRTGVLIETGRDTYYLDIPAYDRWRGRVRHRIAFLLLGLAAVCAAVAAIAVLRNG